MKCFSYLIGLSILITGALNPASAYAESGKLAAADKQAERDKPEYFYPQTPFEPELAKQMMGQGSTTIRGILFHTLNEWGQQGTLFLPSRGSNAVAGIEVILVPATPHIVEWQKLYKKQRDLKKPASSGLQQLMRGKKRNRILKYDDRVGDYMVVAKTDQYGRFTFTNMLPGKYYITAQANISGSFQGTEVTGNSTAYDAYGIPYSVEHTRPVTRTYNTAVFMDDFVIVPEKKNVIEIEAKMKFSYGD